MKNMILVCTLGFLWAGSAFGRSQGFVDLDIRRPLLGGESGQLFVSCSLDTHVTMCFLDTGARQSNVPNDSFFGAYPVVSTGLITGASGLEIPTQEIEIGEFRVGPLTAQKIVVDLQPDGWFANGPLVGNDVLDGQALRFQFNEKRLYFDGLVPTGVPLNSLDRPGGLWVGMSAEVGGQVVKTLWDTGAGMTVVDKDLVLASPDQYRFVQYIEAGDGLGERWRAAVYKTKMEVGGHVIEDLQVVAIDFAKIQKDVSPDVKAIVGFNFYERFNWLVDYQQNLWAVWK
ncbi:MAG: aspartyl protease family protein [Bdellovibrionales bacterium]